MRVGEVLRPAVPGARWVPRQNLHVTLQFLGETDLAGEVAAALGPAAATVTRFQTRLVEMGAFPSARRARVIWVGLDDAAGGLASLAATVASALQPLGFGAEDRPFTAHLTVARLKVPAPATGVTDVKPAPVPFEVDRVTLFRSYLGRPAPRYEALSAHRLAALPGDA